LVVEFLISLRPPFFNRVEPTWSGIPLMIAATSMTVAARLTPPTRR
jgi:hypothetical protein